MTVLEAQINAVARVQPLRITGRVAALRGLTVLVRDLPVPAGSLVVLGRSGGMERDEPHGRASLGEVVGFDGRHAIVMMLGATSGIRPGDRVVARHAERSSPVGASMLGRCVDGLGEPIDGLGPIRETTRRPIDAAPVAAMRRRRIAEPLHTGVRAIDLMATLGRGQRMGIFAGPGVGKSTLLGCIARGASSDVNVVALIGERGREVRDFVEGSLGPEGLARSVVVVATGDESPLMRIRAAEAACAIAEEFRDRGKQVLLMLDSITRFAHAHRQVGLSVGEPPATRGYTPSVFLAMARLLERAGAVEPDAAATADPARSKPGGSITGLYTVLVEGDDMTEPVADAARGILDGHLILTRTLAQRAHYPAIDVLDSISRVADEVTDETHAAARRQVVRLLAVYREVEDLVQIGAYARGSNPESDVAIEYRNAVLTLLQQGSREHEPFDAARARMVKIAVEAGGAYQKLASKGR